MLFSRRKHLKNLSALLSRNRYDSGAGYLTFKQDFNGNLFYEAGEVNLTVDWKCFDTVNGNASKLASRLLQCGHRSVVAMRSTE